MVPGNVVSLQIGFEYARPSDYESLLPAMAESMDAGLRRTVWHSKRMPFGQRRTM